MPTSISHTVPRPFPLATPLRRRGLGPVLILCPATVLHQWVCEFHKWWPPFRVAILHGTGTFSGERQRLVNRMIKCNGVLLTTYAGVRIYKDHLLGQKWDYLVLDEGHKIRNPDADVTIVCKQVRSGRGFPFGV